MLGRDLVSFLKSPAVEPDTLDYMRSQYDAGIGFEVETQHRRRSGEDYWARMLMEPVYGEDKQLQFYFCIQWDITEKRRMQESVAESGRKLRHLTGNLPGVVFQLVCEPEGRLSLSYVSENVQEFLEVPAATLLAGGVRAGDVLELDDWEEALSSMRDRGVPVNRVHCEGRVRGVHGQVHWLRASASPTLRKDGAVVWNGLAIDVTEQMEAERRASTQHRLTETLVDALPGLFLLLDREGMVLRWNQNLVGEDAWSAEAVRGSSFFSLIPAEHRSQVRDQWEHFLTGGRMESEIQLLTPGGGQIPYLIRAVQLDADHYSNVLAVGLELSERVRLEAELRQSRKMEAVGLLAGGVAHDFNNILQVIHGYTRMALDENATEEEKSANLKEVDEAAHRASGLTRQLLSFSRRHPMQQRDVDVGEVLRQHLKLIRRLIGEHIEVVFACEEQPGNVHCDAGQIEQVLMNLCINARDAMPGGGRLEIEVNNTRFEAGDLSVHPLARAGDYVVISIRDNGCGMDQMTFDHVFEPFFTTKGEEQGTGLGLSVVYGIIQQHDGMIEVDSNPGGGTVFRVYLPVSERGELPGEATTPVVRSKGGRETILLAEDETGVRMLALKILKRAGYRVLTAADGVEAVEVFAANSKRVDLLVFDVVMPCQGGWAAYERIRKIRPDIPVLFCSGHCGPKVQAEFGLPSDYPVLHKPYSPEKLLAQIREHLESGGTRSTS